MKKKRSRKALTPNQRDAVVAKTGRRCHVCGARLVGSNWSADHIRPFRRGGECVEDNFLPACDPCNRLRWHYDSRKIRRILQLGVYMWNEIKRKTELGKAVHERYQARKRTTRSRRV